MPLTVASSTKEEPVKRLIVLTLAALAVVAPASASGSLRQPAVPGFFQGKSVGYFDYGPIKLKAGNRLAPIWTVTNPAAGQHNIIDTVPGRADYSPLWQVNKVTFKDGVTPYLLTSDEAVAAAQAAGDVTVSRAPAADFRCPIT